MPTNLEELRKQAEAIVKLDLETLVHPKDAGDYDFELVRDLIGSVQNFYREVPGLNLENLSANQLQDIRLAAQQVHDCLGRIQAFNRSAGDPNTKRTSLIEELSRNHAVGIHSGQELRPQGGFVTLFLSRISDH
jgi:hypothetical protein